MEVIWKKMSSLLNRRLTAEITFHGVLHSLLVGYSMGTATINDKTIQQLMAMREEVLFEVFLDIQKAYDALNLDRYLVIMAAYRVGTRTLQLLWKYWGHLTMVTRAGGYFGTPFKGYHGVPQGNTLPPMIFNVVVDAVIR